MFKKCCQPSQAGIPTGAVSGSTDCPGYVFRKDCTGSRDTNHRAARTATSRTITSTAAATPVRAHGPKAFQRASMPASRSGWCGTRGVQAPLFVKVLMYSSLYFCKATLAPGRTLRQGPAGCRGCRCLRLPCCLSYGRSAAWNRNIHDSPPGSQIHQVAGCFSQCQAKRKATQRLKAPRPRQLPGHVPDSFRRA